MKSIYAEEVKEEEGFTPLQYSYKSAARVMDCGVSVIKKLVEEGRLKSYKMNEGGNNYIARDELILFINERREMNQLLAGVYSLENGEG